MPLVCRWAVKVDSWHPEQGEWNFLLRLLSSEVRAEVQRYKSKADQRRCLVSKLLQSKCVRDTCSVPLSEINIQRTKGGKPFCANHCNPIAAPNFNFNVSHEGGYVVLAAEPVCICGIDVAAPSEARSAKTQTPAELFRALDKQFTAEEWTCIKAAGSEAEQMQAFQRHWSLKEAFVKARGEGLGFDLGRVQFQLSAPLPSGSQSATAKVDGNPLLSEIGLMSAAMMACASQYFSPAHMWRFAIQMLGEHHVVSVALGPPEDVVDAWGVFKGTFQKPNLSLAEMQDAFEAPRPMFSILTISDVIPAELREAFAAAGGDILRRPDVALDWLPAKAGAVGLWTKHRDTLDDFPALSMPAQDMFSSRSILQHGQQITLRIKRNCSSGMACKVYVHICETSGLAKAEKLRKEGPEAVAAFHRLGGLDRMEQLREEGPEAVPAFHRRGGIATGLTKAARQVEQADANNVQYLEAVEEAKILTLEQKYLC